MDVGAVRVKNLKELNRAFARADRYVKREWRDTLKEAAEPVRRTAEIRAARNIRNIGPWWSQMRVGVSSTAVYVAPFQRGTRVAALRRRNLADLLMNRAMQPALDDNHERVYQRVNEMLDRMGHDWGYF